MVTAVEASPCTMRASTTQILMDYAQLYHKERNQSQAVHLGQYWPHPQPASHHTM